MATRVIPRRLLRRVPLHSTAPVVSFALIRLLIVSAAIASRVTVGFPFGGRLVGVLLAVALPWSLGMLWAARSRPALAMHPLAACGDFAVLIAIQTAVPETYGAVRFMALFMVAAHAHFQGERMGSAIAAAGTLSLVIAGTLVDDPLESGVLPFYETLFVVSALATAAVIGGLRTAESSGRIQARELARRTFAAEDALRRRLAVSIHDGPVQELVSLEMILTAARQAARRGEHERVAELLGDAEGLAGRNVRALRDEILALGPHAYEELTFESAVAESLPVWQRRYGVEIGLRCERVELGSDVEGALFRIAQEAVANAGRHAGATRIEVCLAGRDGHAELTIADDGRGFHDVGVLGKPAPGHVGLAGMRERAEGVGGALSITTGEAGTEVRVTVPAGGRGQPGERA